MYLDPDIFNIKTMLYLLITLGMTSWPVYEMMGGRRPIKMHVYTLSASLFFLVGQYCVHWTRFYVADHILGVLWLASVLMSILFLEPAGPDRDEDESDDQITTAPARSVGARLFLVKK